MNRTPARIGFAAAVIGLVAGMIISQEWSAITFAQCAARFSFINADTVCDRGPTLRKTSYAAEQARIASFIASAQREGAVQEAGVYFRDLRNGPVFGVNELNDFIPASLLKLPTALVFMSAAETESAVLEQKVRYTGSTTMEEQRIKPAESAVAGETYTISELVRMMLSSSDNASYEALNAFLSANPDRLFLRQQTFQELGFVDPKTKTEKALSVRGYSSLFTLLYNASYLNAQESQRVLSWLSTSTYDDGLVAGVPRGIRVAHKFGERLRSDGSKELHDCGIIYFPENPYVLCIMTRGSQWQSLEKTIQTISQMVYAEVESRRL